MVLIKRGFLLLICLLIFMPFKAEAGFVNVSEIFNENENNSIIADGLLDSGAVNTAYGGSGTKDIDSGQDKFIITFNISRIPNDNQIRLEDSTFRLRGEPAANPLIDIFEFTGLYFTNEQTATFANFNATVVDTGTFLNRTSAPTGGCCTYFNVGNVTDAITIGDLNLSLYFTVLDEQTPFSNLIAKEDGGDLPELIINYVINVTPDLAGTISNYTAANFFNTSDFINASTLITSNNLTSKLNLTATLFINDISNQTLEIQQDQINGSIVSIVFNDTNITVGDIVLIQFNASDTVYNIDYVNSSGLTVIDPSAPIVTLYELGDGSSTFANGSTIIKSDDGQFTLNFNYSVIDNGDVSNCSYYVASVLETTNTTNQTKGTNLTFVKTDFRASTPEYNLQISCRDGDNNEGNSSIFTIFASVSSPGEGGGSQGGGGGGGGGGLKILGDTCTSSIQCQSNICDVNGSEMCSTLEGLCGNNICDRQFNESFNSCNLDCRGTQVFNLDIPFIENIAPILFGAVIILLFSGGGNPRKAIKTIRKSLRGNRK